MIVQGFPQISVPPFMSPLPSRYWLVLGFCGGLVPVAPVASTFRFFMHELSGCCDSNSNHLHHYLLSTAFICRIASAYFLSYRACDYVKLWLDAGELLWVYLFNFSSPGRPPTTWPLRYVSKSPPTVHDINAWSLHSASTQWILLVELCIVHVFVHVRFHVMMWSSDALDPLRRSLRVCASDIISVPCDVKDVY